MVCLPAEYDYIELYLTFKCNLGCPYCINNFGKQINRGTEEISPQKWIDAINSIDCREIPVTLGGGEPTQYYGFYDVVNGIRKETSVDLLTNLSFNVDTFISNINPSILYSKTLINKSPAYKSIRVSYHATRMIAEEIVSKAVTLQNTGFSIGIFGINHPESIGHNIKMAELCRQNKIYFYCKDYLGYYNGKLFGYYRYDDAIGNVPTKKECKIKELLISPSGAIFKCHSNLYENKNPIGTIHNTPIILESKFRQCEQYGQCNPCDIKMKVDKKLNIGRCSITVK